MRSKPHVQTLSVLKGTRDDSIEMASGACLAFVATWLSPRFSSQDFVQAVTRTAGIQAQVMSAAELALCTRVEGLSPHDVKAALWQDRTLVRTWAMRGTLHCTRCKRTPSVCSGA